MRRRIEGYGTVKQRVVIVGLLLLPIIAMVLVLPLMSRGSVFKHDAGNVRFVVARDLPLGSTLAAVERFVTKNFDAWQWFPADRCLGARFTSYRGGGGRTSRQPNGSVQVYFYFDADDLLARVADHGSLTPEVLKTPEQQKRESDL